MAVLLISRGSMSGGQVIAKCLAHVSKFRCISREDLIASVNKHGELANRVTDSIDKATQDYQKFSDLRRPYKILMRHALLDYARQDDLAYWGYSGHLLVEGISHFIRIRLIAPIQLRLGTTMEQLRCSEEEARDFIRQADEERIRWARFMYGKNIQDPRLYDLCINMDKLSFAGVCSLLLRVIEEKEYQPSEESLAALENLYTATRIEAALVNHPDTFSYDIRAVATDGKVILEGPYLEGAERSLVMRIAAEVPGVKDVDYQPGYVPDLEFLP